MSCSTQNSQPVRFTVTAGALPEGFCGTPQQLFQAMVDRLIISTNVNNSSFVTGSVAPTSNVGPWFKDCDTWYVWDDSLGKYVPITKFQPGGFTNLTSYLVNGTYTIPDGVFKVMVEGWGGGGGGEDYTGSNGGGGGGGGYGKKILPVNPGDNLSIVIGTGGLHGAPAADGTNTSVINNSNGYTMVFGGGIHGTTASGGAGGVTTGCDFSINGGIGEGAYGDGGMGGAGPQGGGGGVHTATPALLNGVVPAGGGAGGMNGVSSSMGGSGANGQVLIWN